MAFKSTMTVGPGGLRLQRLWSLRKSKRRMCGCGLPNLLAGAKMVYTPGGRLSVVGKCVPPKSIRYGLNGKGGSLKAHVKGSIGSPGNLVYSGSHKAVTFLCRTGQQCSTKTRKLDWRAIEKTLKTKLKLKKLHLEKKLKASRRKAEERRMKRKKAQKQRAEKSKKFLAARHKINEGFLKKRVKRGAFEKKLKRLARTRRERGAKAKKRRNERAMKKKTARKRGLKKWKGKKLSIEKKLKLRLGRLSAKRRERAAKRKKQRHERGVKRTQARKQRADKRKKVRTQRAEKREKAQHGRRKKRERALKKLKGWKLSTEKKLKRRIGGLKERASKGRKKRKGGLKGLRNRISHKVKTFVWKYGRKPSKKSKAKIDDCKKIAQRSCKQIENVVVADQKILKRLGDGSKCVKIGAHLIRKTETEYQRAMRLYSTCRVKLSQLHSTKVVIPSRRLRDLTKGKCDFVFRSSAYVALNKKILHMQKLTVKYQFRYKTAVKELKRVKTLVIRQRKKCFCRVKKTSDKTWATITHSVRRGRLASAHKKCKLMQCIERNIPFSSSKCDYRLPALVRKRLIKHAEKAVCARTQKSEEIEDLQEQADKEFEEEEEFTLDNKPFIASIPY
jgi:hypothetical protein